MSNNFLTFVRKFFMSNFSINLKNLRLEQHIGQVELANKLGVSKGIISLWENDKREPSLTHIVKIAKFFNVSADFLIGLNDYY